MRSTQGTGVATWRAWQFPPKDFLILGLEDCTRRLAAVKRALRMRKVPHAARIGREWAARSRLWWAVRGSNSRHLRCKRGAHISRCWNIMESGCDYVMNRRVCSTKVHAQSVRET